MSCIEQHSCTLRSRGYRVTSQRLAVLQALHIKGHLSPTEVYARVRQTGMTEATVYRTLDFLARNGILLVAVLGNGHLSYELAGKTHHHLICRACGAQVSVETQLVSGLIEQIENSSGYRLDAGHLTLFGWCPACQSTFSY